MVPGPRSDDRAGQGGGAGAAPRPGAGGDRVAGVLAVAGRGDLPFQALHRRPLVEHALEALVEVCGRDVTVVADAVDVRRVARLAERRGVAVATPADWWAHARAAGAALLVHDPLCPLVSADFLGEVAAGGRERSVVAFRPVTDTVKHMAGREITGTVDRELLATVSSPVLVAADVVGTAADAPPLDDVTRLASWLRRHGDVEMLRAPSLGRRVDDLASLQVLECLDEVRRRTRTG